MKQKTSWIMLSGLIALSVLFYSFFFNNHDRPVLTTVPTGTLNEVAFGFSSFPDISGDSSNVRIFISHGDGSYFLGRLPDLTAHKHQYSTAQSSYNAYAEVVFLYDDKKKPPKKTGSTSIVVSTSGGGSNTTIPPTTLGGNKIALLRTTNPVPGDSVTYIITYGHPGDKCTNTISGYVNFTYDTTVFYPISSTLDINNYFQETALDTSGGTTYTAKKFNFSNLAPNEERSFFIRLATKENVSTGTVLPMPTKVDLVFPKKDDTPCGSLLVFSDTILGEVVASGHDPNFKTVLNTDMCTTDSITWRIDFQNQGNAPVKSVVIADWIDTLVEYRSIRVVDSKFPVTQQIYLPNAREIRFVMPGVNLRGLQESAVSEDSTRGYITLRGKIQNFLPCNAIANAARIFFDCNPPVTTKTTLAPFPCDSINCDSCTVVLDTTIGPIAIPDIGQQLLQSTDLSVQDYNLLSVGPWVYRWYPADGLDDPNVLSPRLTRSLRRSYTMIASIPFGSALSCQRAIVHINVRPDPALSLSTSWTPTSGCPGNNPIWTLSATASDAPATNLVWQNCASGVDTFEKGNLLAQTCYVAVWDTMTGDYVEQWVNLPSKCPPPTCPLSGVWTGLGILAFALVLFRFLKRNP